MNMAIKLSLTKLLKSLSWSFILLICQIAVAQEEPERFRYKKADSLARTYQGHPVNSLKILSDKLTKPFEDQAEKYRAIFYWVCTNISVDYDLVKLNDEKRRKLRRKPGQLQKWNIKISEMMFSNLLKEQKTLCTGYAYLVKELCAHAKINARIVNGLVRNSTLGPKDSSTPNHSWIAVEINGRWYRSDPTWASGIYDLRHQTFVPKFDNTYFLVVPEIFNQDHFPLDQMQPTQNNIK